MHHPIMEFVQGQNIVDAAIANNVKHLIWSSLDDTDKLTNGLHPVMHFTMKNRVEQYARQKCPVFMKTSFVYAAFFYQNFSQLYRVIDEGEDKKDVIISSSILPHVKLPMFDVHDLGVVVAQLFAHFDTIQSGERILVAGDELTMPEVATLIQQGFNNSNISVKYEVVSSQEAEKKYGFEMADMFNYFNVMRGYYSHNQHDSVEYCKKEFKLTPFNQWFQHNKQHFKL